MSNTFTKNYQDGQALTEAKLDTGFQTVQPDKANLALSTTGSTAGHVLQSQGSNVTPDYVSLNDVIADTVISSTAANAIVSAADSSSTPTAGFSNNIQKASTRSTGTSVSYNGVAASTQVTLFQTSSTSIVDITGLSCNITTNGRPIQIYLSPSIPTSSSTANIVRSGNASTTQLTCTFYLYRDSSLVASELHANMFNAASSSWVVYLPVSVVRFTDFAAAGTYTYKLSVQCASNTALTFNNLKLVAYEL